MPEEKIDIGEDGKERLIRAYLVEAHSIGGLSGSPVFANPMTLDRKGMMLHLTAMHIWIGLVSAHWQIDQDKAEALQRNSGIAIVSPKESVLEVLQHPKLVDMRDKEIQRRRKESAPTLDDAMHSQSSKQGKRIPIPTRDQFMRDLKKATRKREK
jgi:hypothetical protein